MNVTGLLHRHGGRALNRELTRRGLWGYLPRPAPAAPPGPPCLALSFDLDYQADTDALPQLLDLVDELGCRMTLFSIGRLVEQDPGPYAAATTRGHEIANHTWSHPDNPVLNPEREFWHLSEDQMADEIGRAQEVLEQCTGQRPSGFRTPHFKDAPRMMAALDRFPQITYVSTALASKCPYPTPYFPRRDCRFAELSLFFPAGNGAGGPQLMIPLTPCPGLRWSPFCSYSSIRRPSNRAKGAGLHSLGRWEALWQEALAGAADARFASVYFDPMDVMRDHETRAAFSRMLRHALEHGWLITTLAEVERRWRPVVTATRDA